MPTFKDVSQEKYLLLSAVLGKVKGEPVEAVTRMLPKSETRPVFNKIVPRYSNHAFYFIPQSLLRGGIDKVHSGVEVEAVPAV